MAHSHLGLNFGRAGPSQASTSGLQSPPQSQKVQQQQQHQQPNPGHAAPPPLHPEPANPVQPPPAPAENPVVNAPAVDRIPAPAGPAALQPVIQVAQQCAAELAALRARLAQLEANGNKVPPHAGAAPPVLFVDQSTIDKAREAAIAARDGDKKPSLPDIIPGFKANSLDVCEFLVSHFNLCGVFTLCPARYQF
jgi:hypothetical protein